MGKDAVGIIAKVCTYLAENQANILDISQTIVQEYFNMMMIVDLSKVGKSFEVLAGELADIGLSMGVQVKCNARRFLTRCIVFNPEAETL